MPEVQVYSKPDCKQCDATKLHLDRRGVAYRELPLESMTVEARELVASRGISSAPVVVAPDGDMWGGYRPDRIDALARGPKP